MKNLLQKYYPLLLVIAIALALRIHLLLVRGTFWFDEMFSVHFSSLPWKEALRYWIIETNPPLFTLFLRFWLKVIPVDNEVLMRLPSLVAGLVAVALLYILAEKILDRRTAIACSLFFALSDINIFLSTEARGYSFLTLLSIMSFLFYFLIFFQNKKTKSVWAAYFLTNLALVFTHLTALSVPFVQMLGLVLVKPEKKEILKWWSGHLIIGLMWLVWFVPSILAKVNPASLTAWYFDDTVSGKANFLTLLVNFFSTSHQNQAIFTFAAIALVSVLFKYFLDFKLLKQEEKKLRAMLASWAFVLPIAGAMLGVMVTKFYVAAMPALYLVVGHTLAHNIKRFKTFGLTVVASALLMLPSSMAVSSGCVFSWQEITGYIEKNETKNSVIMITPFNEILPLRHYYKGQNPILGLYLRDDNLSLDERIVRYNWNRQVTDKEKLAEWVDKQLSGVNKLFYIQYTDDFDWMHQILIDRGWAVNKNIRPKGFVNIHLFEFLAPNLRH